MKGAPEWFYEIASGDIVVFFSDDEVPLRLNDPAGSAKQNSIVFLLNSSIAFVVCAHSNIPWLFVLVDGHLGWLHASWVAGIVHAGSVFEVPDRGIDHLGFVRFL